LAHLFGWGLDLGCDVRGPVANDRHAIDLRQKIRGDRHQNGRADNRSKAHRDSSEKLEAQQFERLIVERDEFMRVEMGNLGAQSSDFAGEVIGCVVFNNRQLCGPKQT